MDDDQMKVSQRLLFEGNKACIAGHLSNALSLYQQSADAASNDESLLAELSAAVYEAGNYTASLALSDRSLALTKEKSKRQKLYACKAKSLMQMRNYEAATKIVQLLDQSPETARLKRVVEESHNRHYESAHESSLVIPSRLVEELPRYKGRIRDFHQYSVFGHEVPESLFDPSLLDITRDVISMLFAGIGDGRHLHKTILSAGYHEPARDKSFNFTIVDHKAAVIARNILILLMIYEFSLILDDDAKKATSLLFPLFYYTYIAPIMPGLLHDVLQIKIQNAIAMLEQPGLTPAFLNVPAEHRGEILRILSEWQEEAVLENSAHDVRREVVSQRGNFRDHRLYGYNRRRPKINAPAGCEKEQAFYEEFGILTMNWASHDMFYEEELRQAFDNFDAENPDSISEDDEDFLRVISENWKVNPTFIDLKWQRNRKYEYENLVVNHDPFEYGHQLLQTGAEAPEQQGLLNIVSYWFNGVSHGFSRISDRCKVTAYVCDVETFLEQARLDKETSTMFSTSQGSMLPKLDEEIPSGANTCLPAYNRIHLSDIPGYIGGSLSIFLYALPALYPGHTNHVTATCMCNDSPWISGRALGNEYIGLDTIVESEQLFLAIRNNEEDCGEGAVTVQYTKWHRHTSQNPPRGLLPRPHLEAWLYQLFLNIVLPISSQVRVSALSDSPLNLTAFLRVCGHLHKVGYPAHWISRVLEEIISGSIRTTARPPQNERPEEKKSQVQRPILKQSTKPFVVELTTLLGLWQPTLSFVCQIEGIPCVRKIHRYELDFPGCDDHWAGAPVFILVLLKLKVMPGEASNALRPLLLSEEFTHFSTKTKEIRDTGCHIISTWRWERTTETATFWLRSDTLGGLSKDEWGVSIWRTDTWKIHARPRKIRDIRDMGRF